MPCACCCPRVDTNCCIKSVKQCLTGRLEGGDGCYDGHPFQLLWGAGGIWRSPLLWGLEGRDARLTILIACDELTGEWLASASTSEHTEVVVASETTVTCDPLFLEFHFEGPWLPQQEFYDPFPCQAGFTLKVTEEPVECECCCCFRECGGLSFRVLSFIMSPGECTQVIDVNSGGTGTFEDGFSFTFPDGFPLILLTADDFNICWNYGGVLGYYTWGVTDEEGNTDSPKLVCQEPTGPSCAEGWPYEHYTHELAILMKSIPPTEESGTCDIIIQIWLNTVCQDTPAGNATLALTTIVAEYKGTVLKELCHPSVDLLEFDITMFWIPESDSGLFNTPASFQLRVTCNNEPEEEF